MKSKTNKLGLTALALPLTLVNAQPVSSVNVMPVAV